MSDLLTFIGGAAVGTVVTYIAKNKQARKTAEHFIDGVGESVTVFMQKMTPGNREQPAEAMAETEEMKKTEAEVKDEPIEQVVKPEKPAAEEKAIH